MEPSGEASCKRVIDAHEALWNGDFSIEVDDVVVRGDAAMLHGTATGTFEGEFYGVPPTGRAMDRGWMARTLVDGGWVVDDRIYYDQKEMLAQSGVTFPDVPFHLPRMAGAKVRELL